MPPETNRMARGWELSRGIRTVVSMNRHNSARVGRPGARTPLRIGRRAFGRSRYPVDPGPTALGFWKELDAGRSSRGGYYRSHQRASRRLSPGRLNAPLVGSASSRWGPRPCAGYRSDVIALDSEGSLAGPMTGGWMVRRLNSDRVRALGRVDRGGLPSLKCGLPLVEIVGPPNADPQ